MGKKMLILRGNADNDGDQYPDETGKNIKWPIGALHVGAAEAYAKKRGYDPETLGVQGDPQNDHSPQTQEVLKRFLALKLTKGSYVTDSSLTPDQDIHALYGFSGGGYNVYWILQYLAKNKPDELRRIDLVVALGVRKKIVSKADYAWPAYKAIAKKVNLDLWVKEKWKDGGKRCIIPILKETFCRKRCRMRLGRRLIRICSVLQFCWPGIGRKRLEPKAMLVRKSIRRSVHGRCYESYIRVANAMGLDRLPTE
jgi:hypothetical protein